MVTRWTHARIRVRLAHLGDERRWKRSHAAHWTHAARGRPHPRRGASSEQLPQVDRVRVGKWLWWAAETCIASATLSFFTLAVIAFGKAEPTETMGWGFVGLVLGSGAAVLVVVGLLTRRYPNRTGFVLLVCGLTLFVTLAGHGQEDGAVGWWIIPFALPPLAGMLLVVRWLLQAPAEAPSSKPPRAIPTEHDLACWCGSGREFKKCHGALRTRASN